MCARVPAQAVNKSSEDMFSDSDEVLVAQVSVWVAVTAAHAEAARKAAVMIDTQKTMLHTLTAVSDRVFRSSDQTASVLAVADALQVRAA